MDKKTKMEDENEEKTFDGLGVNEVLCEAIDKLKWKVPTKIQAEAIPVALKGDDVIGLAETGSGKTAAFTIPILQKLLERPRRLFALILTPTRELAYQISEQIEGLGASIDVQCTVIVGGMEMMVQSLALGKKPHIIVGTPGRIIDHLENTKGFHLRDLKFLVLDEADRILNMEFEEDIDKILRHVNKDRTTYLYSATMTKKVEKLQRVSVKSTAVRIESNTKYSTVDKLQQYYLFIPFKYKEIYLSYILNELNGNSFMVFCGTCVGAQIISKMLTNLGYKSIVLHGKLSQTKRLSSLNHFKSGLSSILVATDVASRGLDIPQVDVVINYDMPNNSKDYIHRVGRTARAGRSGKSITFVSQYDVEIYQRIEFLLGKKLPLYPTEEKCVMVMGERVGEANHMAKKQIRDDAEKVNGSTNNNNRKKKGGGNKKKMKRLN
ncbi:hypothetical protein SNEBB_004714 [Seison nebaliae]|nr:hypothetical protein SNEBB_004714 [Seison nebaliae]